MFIQKHRWPFMVSLVILLFGVFAQSGFAADSPLVDVQKYDRSIQILAMLLVGFGFLMVF